MNKKPSVKNKGRENNRKQSKPMIIGGAILALVSIALLGFVISQKIFPVLN